LPSQDQQAEISTHRSTTIEKRTPDRRPVTMVRKRLDYTPATACAVPFHLGVICAMRCRLAGTRVVCGKRSREHVSAYNCSPAACLAVHTFTACRFPSQQTDLLKPILVALSPQPYR
jgi:hypothetical protein